MADFTALFAPNVNSYQRLCHPYASPNNACWSHDNRAAGLRIPASSPVARRVENRLPGADANPYLAIAASLAAGLHGIEQSWSRARRSRANSKCRTLSLLYLACRVERLKRSRWQGTVRRVHRRLHRFEDHGVDRFDEITPWERRLLAAQA
jgi:glutamine synthetase